MKKLIQKIIGAAAVTGAMVAAVPAEARHDRGGYRGDHRWGGDRGYRGGRGYYAPRAYRYGYGYRDYRSYRPYRHGGYRYGYYNDRSGDVLAAGIVGLALGAVIASANDDRYRRDRYYDRYGY